MHRDRDSPVEYWRIRSTLTEWTCLLEVGEVPDTLPVPSNHGLPALPAHTAGLLHRIASVPEDCPAPACEYPCAWLDLGRLARSGSLSSLIPFSRVP